MAELVKQQGHDADGNMSFLERDGYEHNGTACDEYTYNGLRFSGINKGGKTNE